MRASPAASSLAAGPSPRSWQDLEAHGEVLPRGDYDEEAARHVQSDRLQSQSRPISPLACDSPSCSPHLSAHHKAWPLPPSTSTYALAAFSIRLNKSSPLSSALMPFLLPWWPPHSHALPPAMVATSFPSSNANFPVSHPDLHPSLPQLTTSLDTTAAGSPPTPHAAGVQVGVEFTGWPSRPKPAPVLGPVLPDHRYLPIDMLQQTCHGDCRIGEQRTNYLKTEQLRVRYHH